MAISQGTTHVIMGPNGSGKSTLAHALIGNPLYTIEAGTIFFCGDDITEVSMDERARRGIFLSFQQPPSIPGLGVLPFLYEAYGACTGKKIEYAQFVTHVEQAVEQFGIRKELLSRMLNDGFSGGEKKQFEILQMLILKPQLVILDEIDSGLDIDALKVVAQVVRYLRQENPKLVVLAITHYSRLLQYLVPDQIHIMCEGSLVVSGGLELVQELEQKGYDAYRIRD